MPSPKSPPPDTDCQNPANPSVARKRSCEDVIPGQDATPAKKTRITAKGRQIDVENLSFMTKPTRREFLVQKVNILLEELGEKKQKVC